MSANFLPYYQHFTVATIITTIITIALEKKAKAKKNGTDNSLIHPTIHVSLTRHGVKASIH
jgi:hypothetical protein